MAGPSRPSAARQSTRLHPHALITTFYGAVTANLIYIPFAGKLKVRAAEESLQKRMIMEGIMSIQSGDNPRIVEQKLNVFIAPNLRSISEDEEA